MNLIERLRADVKGAKKGHIQQDMDWIDISINEAEKFIRLLEQEQEQKNDELGGKCYDDCIKIQEDAYNQGFHEASIIQARKQGKI